MSTDDELCEISSETCTHPETIVCEKCPRYPRKTNITTEDDPTNKNMVIVKKDGKFVGKVSRFNNGFDENGYPLPME